MMSWKTLLSDSDQYNYEYFQRDNVCRICWNTNASKEITKNPGNEIKTSLYEKIIYCLEIDMDKYSRLNKVCCDCMEEIDKFYDFKTFCRETEGRLHQIIQSGNEPNNSDIKIEKSEDFTTKISDDDTLLDDALPMSEVNIENIILKNAPDGMHSVKKLKIKKYDNSKSVKGKRTSKNNQGIIFCSACHLDCGTEDKYSEHNANYHGIENNGTIFKCFGCEKRFKSKKTRTSHELNFCKGLKDGYKCSICERFLPKRNMHEKHMRYHLHNWKLDLPEDLFKCNKCCRRFKTNESLSKHMMEHEVKKNYVCESCGRVFSRQDYLYKHTLTHAGVKRYSCPHCDFKATQRSSLTMHIRKHTGERPYSCDLCPQRCVSSSNLRAHRRRHLHIKKYQCNICDKKFGYKISLDEHVSSIHERTELHSCEHCGATYTRIRGLRRHLAAKHGNQGKQDTLRDKCIELVNINISNDQTDKDIMKDVRYEIKEGELLLIKNQDCDVFMV